MGQLKGFYLGLLWGCLWGLLPGLLPGSALADLVVSHRSPYAPGDTHHDYSTALITLALEKTREEFGGYRLNPLPPRNYTRALKATVDDSYPNLVLETSYEQALTRDSNLSYINFPIDLGVLGYRVCFINPKLKERGIKIDSLEDLRPYTFAHGLGWADTIVLRHNGLNVKEVDNYDGIFLMVMSGRVDFFCRGANEILGEREQFKHLDLTIDDHFMLVYPMPRLFYLNAKNTEAKRRLEVGLQKAFADGSLHALWKTHYKASVEYAGLQGRKAIHLENPLVASMPSPFAPSFMPLLNEAAQER